MAIKVDMTDGVMVGGSVMVDVAIFDFAGVSGILVADIFPMFKHERSRLARNTIKKNRVFFYFHGLEPCHLGSSFMKALSRMIYSYYADKRHYHRVHRVHGEFLQNRQCSLPAPNSGTRVISVVKLHKVSYLLLSFEIS
jgi:hypothetical protein